MLFSRNSVRLGITHSEVWNGTEFCEIIFLKVIQVFFFVLEWFGTSFQKFFFRLIIRNKIPSVFSSAKWFSRTKFRAFLFFAEWFRTKLQGSAWFSLLRNGAARNSELFYLRWNDSNGIPSVFRFAQQTEFLPPVPSFSK